ncbi:thiazole synthase [Nocardia sp. NPDC050435]|uniref:thiazole synthase n=1 Tax=Nocardia sp. NPDC050435 TaxID=3155040 RepID=UPI003401B8FA
MTTTSDPWKLGDKELDSRLMLAIPEDADLTHLAAVAEISGLQSATIKTTLAEPGALEDVVAILRDQGVHILPNTADSEDARSAVTAAHHGAEIVGTPWVKLILTNDRKYHVPNPSEVLLAAKQLISDGFYVYPLITDDPGLAVELEALGCAGIVPQGSPVGSGKGIATPLKFEIIVERVQVPVIIGAGIGSVTHACQAMELGCAAVASAQVVFKALDPIAAAKALGDAVAAGRASYLANHPKT